MTRELTSTGCRAPLAPGVRSRRLIKIGLGSAGAQAVSTGSVFISALWLEPADFGVWATSTSWMAFLTALTSLGAVNAYLTSSSDYLAEARLNALRTNMALAGVGALLGITLGATGGAQLALVSVLVACNIPVAGDAAFLYAACMRRRQDARLLTGLWIAALGRLAASAGLAALLQSAVALALSMISFSAIQILALHRRAETSGRERTPTQSLRTRGSWAVQQVSQMLPAQADYIVASVVASPSTVGLYFVAYQATVAMTIWVAVPLSKLAISEFSGLTGEGRFNNARSLARRVAFAVSAASCLAIACVSLLPDLSGTTWGSAVPIFAIVCAGLPARFLTPVTDAYSLALRAVRSSTLWNVVDGVGTGIAALAALSGSAVWLAVATVSWKIVINLVRYWMVVGDLKPRSLAGLSLVILAPVPVTLLVLL